MAQDMISEGITLSMMALALGMDAFSVCMGMGMTTFRLRQIAKAGALIGAFHALMPLAGMFLGQLLSQHFGSIAGKAGGVLLMLIGSQMILSLVSQNHDRIEKMYSTDTGLILFAIGVSIDSFSVGLSMGIFGARVLATIILFGLSSMILAWAGFFVGRRSQRVLGRYGEALGGVILFIFGVKILFHLHL
ncbi:manganese efflux pump [Sporolactobacillus sp. THM7-4]|nr:manganese efflux pump [Sporolactobacillus sp. THM7-4]